MATGKASAKSRRTLVQKNEWSFFFYKVEGSGADQPAVKTGNVAGSVRLYRTAVSVVLASGGTNIQDNSSAQRHAAGDILHTVTSDPTQGYKGHKKLPLNHVLPKAEG